MPFTVLFDDAFVAEFAALAELVQDQIRAYAGVLAEFGHELGRPWADTLKVTANKVEWRVAFAFDSERNAVLLAAAPKGGKKGRLVYERLMKTADQRFEAHQLTLKAKASEPKGKTTRKKG